jgi:universal stress protein E
MARIRRILVAVKDTSTRSMPAVNKAAQLARGLKAQLELFHAISEPVYVDALSIAGQTVAQLQRKWRDAHLRKLERIAEKLRAEGTKVTTLVVWDSPPYEAVVRQAIRSKADLIVAERHASRHIAPWALRFSDWELLRRSPVPVLLVKGRGLYEQPVILAAIDPGHSFAKPAKLDGAILDEGSAFANALGGSLHALHAYAPATLDVDRLDVNLPNLSAYIEAEAGTQARASLERALKGRDISKVNQHLVARHAVDAIPDTARKLKSSIVVMGAISRSGIKRLLIGNTAERILDSLSCDVLVVKPAHFKSGIARTKRGIQFIATPLVM